MTTEPSIPRLVKWQRLLDRIYDEVLEMHHHREIWEFINTELGRQPDSEIAHSAFTRWYVDSQAAAIRRIYGARDKNSFGALLKSLATHAADFTRNDYYGLWEHLSEPGRDEDDFYRNAADKAFDRFAGAGRQHLDSEIVQADRMALKETVQQVARWADENVAHMGRRPSIDLTFGDLHSAIEFVGDLLRKYYLLLEGNSLVTATPAIQGPWKAPFSRPWI